MAKQRHALTLRCMYGCLLSNPDIEVLPLFEHIDDFTVTQLVKRRGSILLREETADNRTNTTVFARLTTRGQIIQLETFVANTSVEPPPGAFLPVYEEHGRLPLPLSAANFNCRTYLRNLDTIDFSDLNVKIEVTSAPLDPSTSGPTASLELPVSADPPVSSATMPSSESQSMAELQRRSTINDMEMDDDETASEDETLPEITVKKATATSRDDATASDKDQPRVPAGSDYDFDEEKSIAATSASTNKKAHEDHEDQAKTAQPEVPDSDRDDAPSLAEPNANEQVGGVPDKADDHVGVDVAPYRSLTTTSQPLKRKSAARPDPYDMQDDDEPVRTSNPYKKHRGMPKLPKTNDEDKAEAVAATPAKKQRGRPKIIEASDEEEAEEEIVVAKPAQKRKGLPKAAESSDDDADELAAPTPKTKKPKKALLSLAETPVKKASSSRSATPASSAPQGKNPKVLLSCSALKPADKAWMTRNNVPVVQATPGKRSEWVCVVRNKSLPSTVKVLKTLLAGKPVVGDSWITTSRDEGELQDLEDYIHADIKSLDSEEHESLRRTVFDGKILVFTVLAAETWTTDWPEVQNLAADASAAEVWSAAAAKANALKQKDPSDSVIFFGNDDPADDDAEALMSRYGHTVYNRTMFANAIIQAELDLDSDEYKLTLPLGAPKKAKGRVRK